MREEGKTYKECADAVGISVTNYTNKVNGRSPFKLPEANALGDFLHMSNEEKILIFL